MDQVCLCTDLGKATFHIKDDYRSQRPMLREEAEDHSVAWYFGGLAASILILLGEATSWLYNGVWPHVSLLSILSRIDPIMADRIATPAHSWIGLHKMLMGYLTLD